MKINNNVSFGSVTPIIAKKGGLDILKKQLAVAEKNFFLEDLTHLYKGPSAKGLFTNAVAKEKEVGFLITGKEVDKVLYMSHGWGAETAPTRHINRATLRIGYNPNSIVKKLLVRINSGK